MVGCARGCAVCHCAHAFTFAFGSPEKAPAVVNQFLGDMFAGLRETAFATARRAGKLI
jgi:hypothetical protein